MVKRFIYSSVSTHTLIPSLYLLLYPLSGASRVTHMLTLNDIEDTTLGLVVPMGYIVIRATAVAFPYSDRHTGLGFVFLCGGSV